MKQNQWVVIGQTESIRRSLDPCFETIVQTPYLFEENQKLRFVIDDWVRYSEYEEFDEDMVGEFYCTLKDIMLAEGKVLKGKIDRYYPYSEDGRSWKKGNITIRAEKMQISNRFARFKFSWIGVNNNFDRGCCKLRLCKRQRRATYFTIKRQVPGTDKYAEIYRTDPIRQLTSGNFSLPFEVISLMTLCNLNTKAKIRFSVYVAWRGGTLI